MNIVFPTRLSTYLPFTGLLPLTLVTRVVALILIVFLCSLLLLLFFDMNMSYRLAFCKTIAHLMSHNNRRQLPRRK